MPTPCTSRSGSTAASFTGKWTGAAGEREVLREGPLRADRVVRIAPGVGGRRQDAVEDVAQVDRLHVVAGEVDVEGERRHRDVGPQAFRCRSA